MVMVLMFFLFLPESEKVVEEGILFHSNRSILYKIYSYSSI